MASTEDKAYEIMRELDVNYVLVIFGGLTGYSSDGKTLELKIYKKSVLTLPVKVEYYFQAFLTQSHFSPLRILKGLMELKFIRLLVFGKSKMGV